MSVLRNRILAQGGGASGSYHPYGTSATPMIMPLAAVEYDGVNLAYQDMHPLNTGDVNAAPVAATAPGSWGQVVAAGRP
jgi:hypothetical protein